MNAKMLIKLCLLVLAWHQVTSDPCRRNYGGCDRVRGLCWTTSPTTHFCTCRAGYKPVRVRHSRIHKCADIDECREENPCDKNAICRNTNGGHRCDCKCGYVKDYTGQKCLNPRLITGRCVLPKQCFHVRNWWKRPVPFSTAYARKGYITEEKSIRWHTRKCYHRKKSCSCEAGFRFDRCGYCQDKNECAENKHKCVGTGSKCVNTEGSYYCECRRGYTLGPCRKRCYASNGYRRPPQTCVRYVTHRPSNRGSKASVKGIIHPVILKNFRTCPKGTPIGRATAVSFDLDRDHKKDVTLTWVCSDRRTSILKNFATDEAEWRQWSCWTACKATCWGGLQTRSRTCRHGMPGLGGCKGSGSQSRQCYRGKKCPYRVRKDATSLTHAEIRDLVQAMIKYKKDMTVKGFHSASSAHGWPFQCKRKSCCLHGSKMIFLAWHRTMILNYEEGIGRFLRKKTLGLPYWNWLAADRRPPPLAWKKSIIGVPNPFTNMTVRLDLAGQMRTIQRDKKAYMPFLNAAFRTWRNVTIKLAKTHSMHEFAESLESIHGWPHVSACGNGGTPARCNISLADLRFAAFDPLFMFHHSQVDRLWALAQKKAEKDRTITWTTQTALENMEDEGDFGRRHMPFGNKILNDFPVVQAVNTMRDSYYYKELTGVIYDHLGNDGGPAIEADTFRTSTAIRVASREALFIAHYLTSIPGIRAVYVNYYVVRRNSYACNRLTENDRIGRKVLLPTDRSYKNSIPSLVAVQQNKFGDLGADLNVVACYTYHGSCSSHCTTATNAGLNAMPSPALAHYLPNQPVDVYKFNWGDGKKMPGWQINLQGKSQWLYFYGTRARYIYQVSTEREWKACKSTSGRRFRCSIATRGSVCMLPVGTYYLIDRRASHCRRGLKMIVASKI